ncbi:hypothetical protein ACIRP2_37225 [Streptomyces sp. NPDC101194]
MFAQMGLLGKHHAHRLGPVLVAMVILALTHSTEAATAVATIGGL